MAAKRRVVRTAREEARTVASHGVRVRDRVRDLTIRVLRERKLGRGEISRLVDEVLEGASEGLNSAIPASRRSVLRQVFEGLADAVDAVASAATATVRDLRRRGTSIAERDLPAAARRLRAANEELLHAASLFAKRVTGESREEIEELVRRARRAGSRVAESAHQAADAADGRLLELTAEAARAGVTAVRRAASGLAMAAGGLLEGFAEVAAPRPSPRRPGTPARRGRPGGRAAQRTTPAPRNRGAKRRRGQPATRR